MFKKTVHLFSLLFALLINLSVMAATPKAYPPYPDIWGYDLSNFPAIKWQSASVEGYPMDNGDIWFLITYSYDTKFLADFSDDESNFKYMLIKFFKGEQIELSEKGRENFFKIINKQKLFSKPSYNQEFIFSDNSKLKFSPNHSSSKCFSPDFYDQYFLKTDSKGQEKRFSILEAASQVTILFDGGLGERCGAPFYYQKLRTLSVIIPLKDDTFIVFDNGSNLILRFNKNFETKFKPVTSVKIQGNYIMRNFFVIDYSVIENLEKEYPGNCIPFYQNIHDGLLSYFHKKYSK